MDAIVLRVSIVNATFTKLSPGILDLFLPTELRSWLGELPPSASTRDHVTPVEVASTNKGGWSEVSHKQSGRPKGIQPSDNAHYGIRA